MKDLIKPLKNNIICFFRSNRCQYLITLAILLFAVIFGSSVTSTTNDYSSTSTLAIVNSIIYMMIISVALASILVSLPRKLYVAYPLLFTIFTLFLYTNSVFARFFGRVIPKSMYSQVTNLTTMDGSAITSLFLWSDIVAFVMVLVSLFLLPFMARRIKKSTKFIFALLIFGFLFPVVSYLSAGYLQSRFLDLSRSESLVAEYEKSRYLSSHFFLHTYSLPVAICVELYIDNASYPDISKSQYDSAKQFVASMATHNISELKVITDKPNNLIVILVESLNSEALCKDAMPFTYNLSQDSSNILIPNIEDAIGIGASMDGQLLTLSGLHPNKEQFTFTFVDKPYDFPSIFKVLDVQPNHTNLLSTITDTTFWCQQIAGRAMGIGKLYGSEIDKSVKNTWLKDRSLVENVIENIDKLASDTPFVYAILTGDSHPVFDPAAKPIYPISSGLSKERREYYIALQRTDREIANLFTYLNDKQMLDNTTIAIVADHCINEIYSGGCAPLMPLLIVNPLNSPKFRPVNNPSQVSVLPTIIHAMGVANTTYMGLTPSMLSPRIDSLTTKDFEKVQEVSMSIMYGKE